MAGKSKRLSRRLVDFFVGKAPLELPCFGGIDNYTGTNIDFVDRISMFGNDILAEKNDNAYVNEKDVETISMAYETIFEALPFEDIDLGQHEKTMRTLIGAMNKVSEYYLFEGLDKKIKLSQLQTKTDQCCVNNDDNKSRKIVNLFHNYQPSEDDFKEIARDVLFYEQVSNGILIFTRGLADILNSENARTMRPEQEEKYSAGFQDTHNEATKPASKDSSSSSGNDQKGNVIRMDEFLKRKKTNINKKPGF